MTIPQSAKEQGACVVCGVKLTEDSLGVFKNGKWFCRNASCALKGAPTKSFKALGKPHLEFEAWLKEDEDHEPSEYGDYLNEHLKTALNEAADEMEKEANRSGGLCCDSKQCKTHALIDWLRVSVTEKTK